MDTLQPSTSYVRLFRGTDRMHKRTALSIGSWAAITLVLWIIACVIAEAIPVFNDLLNLILSAKIVMTRGYRTDQCPYRLLSFQAGSRVSTVKGSRKLIDACSFRGAQWHLLVIFELGDSTASRRKRCC